jgi:quinol monooxygenase YgiN
MIYVVASVRVKEGRREEFLEIFKANVPAVLAEDGCIEYAPTVDVDAALSPQKLDPAMVTVVEKWESTAALQAHLKAPHMLAYRENTRDLVESVTLKVLVAA